MSQPKYKSKRGIIERLETRQLLAAEISSPFGHLGMEAVLNEKPVAVSTDHYFVNGEAVPLTIMPQRLAVRWKDDVAPDLPSAFEPLRAAGDGVTIYQVPTPVEIGPNVQDGISRLTGYAGEVPVYLNVETGSEAVLVDELIVSLAAGITASDYFSNQKVFSTFERLAGTTDQFIAKVGGQVGDSDWEISRATLDVANSLRKDPELNWVAPNFYQSWQAYAIPNDPRFENQWHAENTGQGGGVVDADVDLSAAWDVNPGGSADIVVGIIDDGVATDHEDILNYANPGEIPGDGIDNDGNGWVDDVFGWNFVNDNNQSSHTPDDPHGTSVAGVAAGTGDNGVGIAGAAYNSRILSARIFDTGDVASDANIAAAIYYMGGRTADGTGTWRSADIVNNSWGGGGPSAAIEAALQWGTTQGRQGSGALYLFATGNDFGAVSQPAVLSASIPGVVAVGATNNQAERSNYSNFGAQVDFVTPSNDTRAGYLAIDTTDIPGAEGYSPDDYTGTGAAGFGGTSSATPLATGIAALALAELADQNILLTPAQMRDWMRANTDLIGGVYDLSTGHNDEFGYGRLNAGNLLQSIGKAEISIATGTTDLQDNVTPVDIEAAFVGQAVTQMLRIRNQGTSTLVLSDATIIGSAFRIASPPADTSLDVGEWTTLEVEFSPTASGSHAGTLAIGSNDLDEAIFEIPLLGHGVIASIIGNVFEDQNGNGVRDGGEVSLGNQTIYLDLDGNGLRTQSDQSFTAAPVAAILDNSMTQSTITVGGVGLVNQMEVRINVTHTYTGDLEIVLVNPDGDQVVLASGVGGSGQDFFDTVFADDADVPIETGSAPFTGRFIPNEALADVFTDNMNGDWTLEIHDQAGGDIGTFNEWSIHFIEAEPTAKTTADGTYVFTDLPAGGIDVAIDQSGQWSATSDPAIDVTVLDDDTVSNVDFGIARRNRVYGRVFDDVNRDGVPDTDELGLPGEIVYVDSDLDGQFNAPIETSFIDTPVEPIQDVSVTTVTQTIDFIGQVTDLNVRIDLSHSFDADLFVSLQSPSGTEVLLFGQVGGGGQDFTNTILDDEATDLISSGSAPFTGTFRPMGSLSDFDGETASGTWSLVVSDTAFADVGTINEWELIVETAEPSLLTDDQGGFQFDLIPGSTDIRFDAPAGRRLTQPADGKITAIASNQPLFVSGFGVTIDNGAPRVDAVVINNGEAQRSGIQTVQVQFDRVVDIDLASGDVFEFVNQATSQFAVDIPVVDHSSGKTVVDLTFASGGTVNAGGGLLDGNYRLILDATRITASSVELDGDDDGSAGGNYVFGAVEADAFYRKYGDFDASGDVGLADFAVFRSTFGLLPSNPAFRQGLDHESNGTIDLSDFAAFRSSFGS